MEQKKKKEEKAFDVSNRRELDTFDDLNSTKLSKRANRSRFGGLGVEFGGIFSGFAMDDDDDEAERRLPLGGVAGGASSVLGGVDDEPGEAELGPRGHSKRDVMFSGFGMISGLTADLRKGGELPDGLDLVGGDPVFEEQEDGSQALVLPEGSYLKLALPYVSPWSLEDDGRLHSYSLMLALRLDRLPATTQPIFNGGAAPAHGEQLEHVQVFKNGGIGALGQMGIQEASLRPERWAWLTITRKEGELRTYMNGRLCAEVKLQTKEEQAKKKKMADDSKRKQGDAAEAEAKDGKKPVPVERFCIDPKHLALFASPEAVEGDGFAEGGGERGLCVQFVKLESKCWGAETVRAELNELRGQDEEAALLDEAEVARLEQLCLQPLYAKPPPIWLHPAFAAEFGDAFIGGTALESGSLHVSLEVLVLSLQKMLQENGTGCALPHKQKAALNSATSLLNDAKKVAHKLAHAMAHPGQLRLYLARVLKALGSVAPGDTVLLPCCVGGAPLMFVVERYPTPNHAKCTFTVVSCDSDKLQYHRASAEPPKIKFQTCLELRAICFERLQDEAFWGVLCFASTAGSDGRFQPREILYEILLSFLAQNSLEQAMITSQELAEEDGDDISQMRTPRRSNSAHYGCSRHTLRYLLLKLGLEEQECRRVSLMLRMQMLQMARHDLGFVRGVSAAERTVLHVACRQLAYKAAKLARAVEKPPPPEEAAGSGSADAGTLPALESTRLSTEEIADVYERINNLKEKLTHLPGLAPHAVAPPPLILCEEEAHLGRPPLSMLLGAASGARLLAPPQAGVRTASDEAHAAMGEVDPDSLVQDVEVLGLYFSASWCPACRQTTPLVANGYKSLRSRGHKFEIVFVSQGASETEFDQYRSGMPWPAMPFGGHLPALLAQAFHVSAIPCLVLLDGEGNLLSVDGIRLLRKHTRAFPWKSEKPPETPHIHPLLDRLLHHEPVDPGPARELPYYTPVDFLQQPAVIHSLADAVAALRHCDRLSTLVAVQNHTIKNTMFLKIALIEHTFTQLLPMPKPESHPEVAKCIWRSSMLYAEQLDMLLLLQRIMEHFAASIFTCDHTMPLDATRMVVPACIAAVSDCILRQIATDIPSEVSIHFRGDGTSKRKGFSISSAALARQSAIIPCHTAELNTARTCVLDYFAAQPSKSCVFNWERNERPDKETERWLTRICKDLAFPTDKNSLASFVADTRGLLIKNFPEMRCFRDIVFYFKFFLNPDIRRFPAKAGHCQRDAELQFRWDADNYRFEIQAFSDNFLLARPKLKRGEPPPTHRFPDLSSASEYTKPSYTETEDDVLHMWELPDFGELDLGHARALGQHDSELLLSYLTVPYLRIPLIASFFASDDRIHSLQSPTLQKLLDAVCFQPGNHLPLVNTGHEPVDVPSSAPTLLGTPHHLLINELCHSPHTLLSSVLKLARQVIDLDTGTYKSSTAPVILFVVRFCCRIDNYVSMVLDYDAGTHACIVGKPVRNLELAAGVREQLEGARSELRSLLWGDLRRMLQGWYHKLVRECEGNEDDLLLDTNTGFLCSIHGHMLLMLRNASVADLTLPHVTSIVCGMVFLSTRHEWNINLLDKPGSSSFDGWRIPEHEIYEAMHVLRRKLVERLRTKASQSELDTVMDSVVRVSASSGSLLASPEEVASRWAYVAGPRNSGRFTLHSSRNKPSAPTPLRPVRDDTGASQASDSKKRSVDSEEVPPHAASSASCEQEDILTMADGEQLAVEVDVQVMQLTLKASHPMALPQDIARLKDVTEIFGAVSMQACLMEQSTHRSCYRLVGRSHDIAFWPTKDAKLPQLEHFRPYYPEELFPSEKIWLPSVLEPVKKMYLTFPKPLEMYLQEDPIPEDAQVAYLVGKQPEQGGVWREIFAYRARRMVHIYRIESHGRRYYRSLEYCSDARFCLREMQPSIAHRAAPWPQWERHGAGHPYADSHNQPKSAVISRDWTVDSNLSMGTETFMPARLLYGVIPAALLEAYEFWQDEDDHLRGYPTDSDARDIIYVRIGVGAHVAFAGSRFTRVNNADKMVPPARALVLRLQKSRLQALRDDVHAGLQTLESFVREKDLLAKPFEPNFQICKALAKLLRKLASWTASPSRAREDHDSMETDDTAAAKGAQPKALPTESASTIEMTQALEDWLRQVDLTPFSRHRKRHRLSHIVLPALLDAVSALFDGDAEAASKRGIGKADDGIPMISSASLPAADSTASASDVEDEELVLLDMLHAPAGSYLYHLADVMTRIENLSHVLAWARFDEKAKLTDPEALSHSDLLVVTLPRLKLTFQARRVGTVVRLFSVDHADLYITNERNHMTTELLAGMPHSLLLSNSNGEMSVLVPTVPPCRPNIMLVPFSTDLVLYRSDKSWYSAAENPYYVYPVHVSLSFLYSTTLASALYLMLLRYLNRQYKAVVQLIDTVASDTDLTIEENNSLQFMTSSKVSSDQHPDAHACRLKISLVVMDSPVSLPWDLSCEMAAYVRKLLHVSADCRLSAEEELTLLRHCVCDPADRRFDPEVHTVLGVLSCKNRRSALRAIAAHGGDMSTISCHVELPARPVERRWIYEWHPNVLELSEQGLQAQLHGFLEELAMKYSPSRTMQLDNILSMVSTLNVKGPLPPGNSIATGGFLNLYAMFQGSTECRVHQSNCSASLATLLLPFFPEMKEPSLLGSLLLTLARQPLLGPFLPEFVDSRKYKRRDVFTGLPLPDEAEAPLGKLILQVIRELLDLGSSPRRHEEVTKKMLQRRVDSLTKARMWGGFSSSWSGSWGGGMDSGWGGGGFGGWGRGGSRALGGWGGYQQMEEMAKDTEKQCAEELESLAHWKMLRTWQPPCRTMPAPSTTFLLPDGSSNAKLISDHSCALRDVRAVESCRRLKYEEGIGFNSKCPIYLVDFDEGDEVMRLPDGHLISVEGFDQLLDIARRERKTPTDPFTRRELPPLTPAEEMRHFCSAPLEVLGLDRFVTQLARRELGQPEVRGELGFDISAHPDARAKVALDMLTRLTADAEEYAHNVNNSSVSRCVVPDGNGGTTLLSAEEIVRNPSVRAATEAHFRLLLDELSALREKDATVVRDALPLIIKRANAVPMEGVSREDRRPREIFKLQQLAEQEATVSTDHMLCLLISSQGESDLKATNPYISDQEVDDLFDLAVSVILHSSRVGQINRCVSEVYGLLKLLRPRNGDYSEVTQKTTISAIALKAQALAENLLGRRHYVCASDNPGATQLGLQYDPRFLLFEFTHNIVLREAQVQLVHEFVSAVRDGRPLVKQMLMGGGKTTVVGPLLALLLGDGHTLVMQTMPPALLEQSKATLRATFSSIIRKRVFTLSFDRSSEMRWATVEKLQSAARNRGAVLCTASTIKSIQLKLLEKMDMLRDPQRKQHPSMEHDVRCLGKILGMFQSGCLIMDEVDLLLHPLRAELNFPIGDKHSLDFSPERWTCAIHALDAVFFLERNSMSVSFHQSGRAHKILEELSAIIEEGYQLRALQRSPHLVLLNAEWYHTKMMPIVAKWMLLWLEANHISGLKTEHIDAYITSNGDALVGSFWAPWVEEQGATKEAAALKAGVPCTSEGERALHRLYAYMEGTIGGNKKAFQLLNLSSEWLRIYLPHCLQKIDRVSFGLLSMAEYERLVKAEPHMPRSRFKLAIPFVGKDVPSRASEFAHPDIIIGLTILAYRYEGLRKLDFEHDVITLLRAEFEKEVGPFQLRKSAQRYETWVTQAGGKIKGKKSQDDEKKDDEIGMLEDDNVVVPLWLLKQSNDEQMQKLFTLLRKQPTTIHWYLENVIFPSFMQHQRLKLSASGQELGGSMLFSRRLGFSGTPSDLLPLDLGRCGYERGSDGKMLSVLTDPSVLSVQFAPSGWTVRSLLRDVATAEPRFNALIDSGALITGLSNRQVAKYMLANGLGRWCEGVVFLDEHDEKMILVKASGRVLKLSQCGIAIDKRFAFYDQIHTTGMDIKHSLNARAALTLGKDMTFRDLAQGAFRMRGIGEGQVVSMLIIPEVAELMQRQLAKAGRSKVDVCNDGQQQVLRDVSAWLVINSMMTERVQFDQLCHQNLANIWRQNAFSQLMAGHHHFKVRPEAAMGFVLDMLGEAFVSNREGSVSRAKIEGRILGIYFESSSPNVQLLKGLRTLHEKVMGGDGFQVIHVSSRRSQEEFSKSFREQPWLAIPFAHAQRRSRLMQLFELNEESNQVILIDQEGNTITRDGAQLIEIGRLCDAAKEAKDKQEAEFVKEREAVDKERAKLKVELDKLKPIETNIKKLAQQLGSLAPRERAELTEFMKEPEPSIESQQLLKAAGDRVASAANAVKNLTDAFEEVRTTNSPTPELRAAVEAVCVLLDTKPDFSAAQHRIMRSANALPRRLLHFDKDKVPKAASNRLRRFVDSNPPSEDQAVAFALREWVLAVLHYDQIRDEASMSLEQTSCTPVMQAACGCVCDLYGLDGVEEDLVGTMLMAEAFPTEKNDADDGADKMLADEIAKAESLEGLQNKVFRLKQFLLLLRKDMETSAQLVNPQREQLKSAAGALSDRYGFMNILKGMQGESVMQAALTAMLLMMNPEALQKEQDPFAAATTFIGADSSTNFQKFLGAARNIESAINDGRTAAKPDDWVTAKGFVQFVDQNYKNTSWRSNSSLCVKFCEFVIHASGYYEIASELIAKKAQAVNLEKELQQAVKQLEKATENDDRPGGVSASTIKAVIKGALEGGVVVTRAQAEWALNRTNGDEVVATKMVMVQKHARKAVAALKHPGICLNLDLQSVTGNQVRRVRNTLKSDAIKSIVESVEALGANEQAADGNDMKGPAADLSPAESLLLRWVLAVSDFHDKRKSVEPQEQKLILMERKVQQKVRALEKQLHDTRQEVLARAAQAEIPAQLFPAQEPWLHFPWDTHCRARTEAEDKLRQAIGLREAGQLEVLVKDAEAVGLNKLNSRVYFEAVELCDLLQAEGADMRRNPAIGLHEAIPAGTLRPIRERTQEAKEQLHRAMTVFLEDVITSVPDSTPTQRHFVQVLSELCEKWKELILPGEDSSRRDAILSIVSDSVGVSDIETEQCREQEQEKEQEKEQEQEIEMERYVDMAYQRDGEEPHRWAFCTLGEQKEGSPTCFSNGTFYPAANFRLHSRSPLPFPSYLCMSRNHFNLDWLGERRMKNAVMVLEWVPDVSQIKALPPKTSVLTAAQEERLQNSLSLLDVSDRGSYGLRELREALRSAEDLQMTDAELEPLLDSGGSLSYEQLRSIITSGVHRQEQTGRYFVLLSLAEAETIRCILHMRQGKPLIPGSNVALALRCIPANDELFDASDNHPASPAYQRSVSYNVMRFIDSAMHFRPAELNVLLRSIPAPPAQRRLFFQSTVACRRRLAKRWEQTPLAKLFTLEDEWSMLKQRAQAVRVREAIKARGLLLHDAFLKFDYDRNGLLSLAEVYGALDWLGVPSVTPADILFFVRGISQESQLSYSQFMDILMPPDEEEQLALLEGRSSSSDGVRRASAVASDDGQLAPRKQQSRVTPKGQQELEEMLKNMISEEQRVEADLEQEERKQAERAKLFLQEQMLDSDFSWIKQTKANLGMNPRTTYTSVFYDFSRGVVGTQQGGPLWTEARGKWLSVRQGRARIPCFRGFGETMLVLRVPFRKNGGGMHLNQYTVTLQARFADLAFRGLLCTGGWDQWSKVDDNEEEAQCFLDSDGGVGAHGSFGDASSPRCEPKKWHTITCVVDAVAGSMHTFIDGREVAECRAAKLCKDGIHSLKGRLAIFFARKKTCSVDYYLRSLTIHNRALESEQVRKEHTMLEALLLEDAIAAAPSFMQPPLALAHTDTPFTDIRSLRERAVGIKKAAIESSEHLWQALLAYDHQLVTEISSDMETHDLAICARWKRRDPLTQKQCVIDENTAPFGETLLHAASYVGNAGFLKLLIDAGAHVSRRGSANCTALHAASAGGNEECVGLLLKAGCKVSASSTLKRTALHIACSKGANEVAKMLILGGADPYSSPGGGDSVITVLRRQGGRATGMISVLDQALLLRKGLDKAPATSPGVDVTANDPVAILEKDREAAASSDDEADGPDGVRSKSQRDDDDDDDDDDDEKLKAGENDPDIDEDLADWSGEDESDSGDDLGLSDEDENEDDGSREEEDE